VAQQVAVNGNSCAVDRMAENHPDTGQQQTVAAELALKKTVVQTLAMRGIANDRMADVLQMAAQLMVAAREWLEFNQRIA